MGDFNAILDSKGKKGNKKFDKNASKEFRKFLQVIDVMNIPSRRFEFTWSNKRDVENRIYTKIDHAFCNEEWNNLFPNYQLDYEAPSISDLSPGILSVWMSGNLGPKPFKFIKGWMKHPQFKETRESSRCTSFKGTPRSAFSK